MSIRLSHLLCGTGMLVFASTAELAQASIMATEIPAPWSNGGDVAALGVEQSRP